MPFMRILFIDPVCNKPYDSNELQRSPLGGTEATVIRLAEALALQPAIEHVDVMQHNRNSVSGTNPRFLGSNDKLAGIPTHIVLLRSPFLLESLREQFPLSNLYFWAHDEFLWPGWQQFFRIFLKTATTPICVSRWHEQQMHTYAAELDCPAFPSHFIYNPIDDDLAPNATPVEPDKLIFFSSPHKGLELTLNIFQALLQYPELANLRLFVSNPGYHDDYDTQSRSVVNLGKLPHHAAMQHVRSSFAALHLNTVCPETFGLVHAEANAVGTPFLNAPLGAGPEICPCHEQFVQADNPEAVAERLIQWRRHGRPQVRVNSAFRRSAVAAVWQDMFSTTEQA